MPILIPVLLIGIIVLFSSQTNMLPDFSGLLRNTFMLNLQIDRTPAQGPQAAPVVRTAPPAQQEAPQEEFPPGISPYQGKVRIANVNKSNSQVTLATSLQADEVLVITGWRLSSRWQGTFEIPLGTDSFLPSHLFGSPQLGAITVRPGEIVLLSSQESPFGRGLNYKANACFGFLAAEYGNVPGSFSCRVERPELEEISSLPPACQDYILRNISYTSCRPPSYQQNQAVMANSRCSLAVEDIAAQFQYQACWNQRKDEPNFNSGTWYLFSGDTLVHPSHDVIELRDRQGLLVDQMLY